MKFTPDGFLFVMRGESQLRVFDAHAMTLEKYFTGAEAQGPISKVRLELQFFTKKVDFLKKGGNSVKISKSPFTEAFTAAQINCLEEKVAPNSIINLQELYVNSTNTDECQNCSIKMIKGLIIHCDIETLIQGNCQNVTFITRTKTNSIYGSDKFYRFSKS